MERLGNAVHSAEDSDDEGDEDYVADRDDAGSPTGDTDQEGSDSDASEDGDEEKPVKEAPKEPVAPEPAAARKTKREEGEDDGRKKKKKKKDPNAPRRALSTFMYFSQAEREVLKKEKPGLAFKEVGRIIGDKWKNLSEEEKEPYEKSARFDKARYAKEMAEYRSRSGKQRVGGGSSGEESD